MGDECERFVGPGGDVVDVDADMDDEYEHYIDSGGDIDDADLWDLVDELGEGGADQGVGSGSVDGAAEDAAEDAGDANAIKAAQKTCRTEAADAFKKTTGKTMTANEASAKLDREAAKGATEDATEDAPAADGQELQQQSDGRLRAYVDKNGTTVAALRKMKRADLVGMCQSVGMPAEGTVTVIKAAIVSAMTALKSPAADKLVDDVSALLANRIKTKAEVDRMDDQATRRLCMELGVSTENRTIPALKKRIKELMGSRQTRKVLPKNTLRSLATSVSEGDAVYPAPDADDPWVGSCLRIIVEDVAPGGVHHESWLRIVSDVRKHAGDLLDQGRATFISNAQALSVASKTPFGSGSDSLDRLLRTYNRTVS